MGNESYCSYCLAPFALGYDKEKGICRYCKHEWKLESVDYSEIYQEAARLRNEEGRFDDASELYDELLKKNPADHQALWGRLLCKYGVVYIEKENEHGLVEERVITCFRKEAGNFLDEYNQLKEEEREWNINIPIKERTQRNADAKTIFKIQNILHQESSAFDIFICYKETDYDEKGRKCKTKDAEKARTLYRILRRAGYRVFFAPVNLKGKAGADYEAEIYNAIESAKVMLVLGTKPDYLNSVWMRNEWVRFLWFKDEYVKKASWESKELIPLVDFTFDKIPKKISSIQGFKWEKESKNNYSGLRIRLDELIPKSIPSYSLQGDVTDAQKVKDGLLLQYEGKSEEAYKCFLEAAQSGNTEACYYLGCDHYGREDTGTGDLEKAFKWFKKAAECGYPKAMWQLSFMYEMGIGTEQDPANAMIWKRYYDRSQNI